MHLTYTLPKQYRIHESFMFKRVLAEGKRIASKGLVAYYLENKMQCHRHYPRLGIIVRKQNIKRAVTRNQLKRMVRESFRHARHTFSSANFDIVVLIKQYPMRLGGMQSQALGNHFTETANNLSHNQDLKNHIELLWSHIAESCSRR